MTKILKAVFAVYLLVLLWLVLFKFSFSLPSTDVQAVNIIPFAGNSPREMWDNFIVFIPFGLLLGANFKQLSLIRGLVVVGLFSLTMEVLQFIFAIGASDVTDVITNTLGGFAGLGFYGFMRGRHHARYLDMSIGILVMTATLAIVLLRIFVFRVRY